MKKILITSALALLFAVPAAQSAELVIKTHHRHHHGNVQTINEDGQRLHHRHHGTLAFYDHGRRHHRPDAAVVVTSSIHRHHNHPVVIENDSQY
ncbi:hypothetical protein GA829_19285 [Mesorhizobium sp. INR15]|nr:hypothetical protein GA829_19285 [Mesorhizobium sp. INR15]